MSQRQREMMRLQKRIKITAIIAIVTIVVATITIMLVVEKHDSKDMYQKHFTIYDVKSGDTVSEIYDIMIEQYPDTATYNRTDYMEEIQFINNLDYEYSIKSGTILVVPYLNGLKELGE